MQCIIAQNVTAQRTVRDAVVEIFLKIVDVFQHAKQEISKIMMSAAVRIEIRIS